MVNLGTGIGLLSLGLTLKARKENAEMLRRSVGDENGSFDEAQLDAQKATDQKLERLIQIESKNQPTPGDKDAYASATVELSPGETAEVTIQPESGYHLRVKRIYFDRRTGHDYEFNVGGEVTSVNHKAVYTSPKAVTQSDIVTATVTNRSSDTTVVDFEMDAWAEQPSAGGM